MTVELGWKAITEIAGWAQRARAEAKNKRQQRFAHVVEHIGVFVSGLRLLNIRANRLLLPLVYFAPDAWPTEKREQVSADLILFAHEDVVLPRVRASLSALESLINNIDDLELRNLVSDVIYDARHIFVSSDFQGRQYEATTVVQLLNSAKIAFIPDIAVRDVLPELTELVRTAQSPSEVETLRELVDSLLQGSGSAIAPYAEQSQAVFGRVLSLQSRIFPSLPSPDWVWKD